jgi:hypothetical protein
MNNRIRMAALVVGMMALWPTAPIEAASPHVFRFQAQWVVNPNGDCGTPHSVLFLNSTQADVDVVELTYQFTSDPCTVPLQIVQGTGQVDISGNLSKLFVEGTLSSSSGDVDIDLTLKKTGNLPDPGPGQKAVSATARGEVVLDGEDLTGGQPSTSAQITRSRS